MPRRALPPTAAFLLRRSGRLLVSLAVVLVAAFAMIHLIPGDPIRAALGPTAPADLVAARRAELGLDDPLWKQFVHYLAGLVHGDLGTSFTAQQPVGQIIADRLPNTLSLAVTTVVVALLVSVPLGIWLGVRTENGRNRGTEITFTSVSGAVAVLPEYVVAVGLVALFAVHLGWFPPAGRAGAQSYVLPVISLAIGPVAVLSRLVRVETLRVLSEEYIRMARSKRLPPARLYLRHVLPNTLTATLTVGGLLLSALVAGSVLIEYVFAWPGMGSSVVASIIQKDYPVVQATVLLYGTIVLVVNMLVDLVLGLLDPRSTIRGA
jgi:peptide/nickel transport system permease protein